MEKFFWADQVAENIIKENGKKKKYVCTSGITPSGTIHIGNFREVITTDLVVNALKKKGKDVIFIYSWDDYDRFRKVPENLPESKKKEYESYIGMPLSEIPSPFPSSLKKKESYAEHFEREFENSLKRVGIKPKFVRQSIMNKKCKYSSLLKLAIDKKDYIMKILNKYRKDPLKEDWYPITVYCEKCRKDSTKVISVDGYIVEYECKCGFRNKADFRKKGIVKAPWRVDWPMRWKYEDVDFEPGGIDHSVHGGSFTTAKEIVNEIFNGKVPTYQFYDWIKIKGGKEFSSSKGNALTLDDVEEIYEPEVLRYIFVSTRPNKGFEISFDNDVIKIYEDFDSLERKYYEKKANQQEKRIYELSLLKVSKKKPDREGFRHLITSVQTGKVGRLNKHSKNRAKKVKTWLDKYAGDDMKFEVQERINSPLNENEKRILSELNNSLKKKNYTEDELFQEFYKICGKVNAKNTEFFDVVYRVLINKKKGPRLASLILSIGKEKVIKLLNQIK